MSNLSLKVTVSATDYYLSDETFLRTDANFHYGFLLSGPRIKKGQVKGGFYDFEVGQVQIENRPLDENHPFGGSRYTSLIQNLGTAYPFTFQYGLQDYDWITGTLVLEKVDRESLTFSVNSTEYNVDATSTVTDNSGNTVTAPFAYGAVTHFTPLIRTTSNRWHNPTGLTSGITVFEDGVSRTINAITSDYIEITGYSADAGEVSLTSTNSKTLEDFFDYVATQLSLSVTTADTTRATNASSYDVKIKVNAPIPLLELASDVAAAYNHQFDIRQDSSGNSTLHLIDRAYAGASITSFKDYELLTSNYTLGFPLGGVSSSWGINVVEGGRLVGKSTSARSANKPKGREFSVNAYADQYSDITRVQGRIDAIKDIEKLSKASVTIPDINTEIELGDRIRFRRLQDFLECTLTVRAIDYDFSGRTTALEGDATLSEFVRDF